MISRRNFFSIVTLMLVLLFLVMATNDLKDRWNDYAVNTYTETAEKYPSKVRFPWSSGSEKAEEDAVAEEGNSSLLGKARVFMEKQWESGPPIPDVKWWSILL